MCAMIVACSLVHRAQAEPGEGAELKKPMVLEKRVEALLAERIAKALIAASPVVEPDGKDERGRGERGGRGGASERDRAGERLALCGDLIESANGRILWGGFNADQGYDPEEYRLTPLARDDFNQLTEFNPIVWAKLYLSMFMFPGTYEVKTEGHLTILAIDARFRSELDPGEYPYPFWHSPNKWTAYLNTQKVLLIFEPGRLVAAFRQSPPPASLELVKRRWDAKWEWTDEKGEPQPRVALFTYLFSKDNPHVGKLDESYRELEKHFRAQNCLSCHAPDNGGRINDLLLLNYPNQALVMRRSLVAVMEENQMPPGSRIAHEPPGIQDEAVRQDLIRLAKVFEKQADLAFAFEKLRPQDGPAMPASAPGEAVPAAPTSRPTQIDSRSR